MIKQTVQQIQHSNAADTSQIFFPQQLHRTSQQPHSNASETILNILASAEYLATTLFFPSNHLEHCNHIAMHQKLLQTPWQQCSTALATTQTTIATIQHCNHCKLQVNCIILPQQPPRTLQQLHTVAMCLIAYPQQPSRMKFQHCNVIKTFKTPWQLHILLSPQQPCTTAVCLKPFQKPQQPHVLPQQPHSNALNTILYSLKCSGLWMCMGTVSFCCTEQHSHSLHQM